MVLFIIWLNHRLEGFILYIGGHDNTMRVTLWRVGFGLIMEPARIINAINALGFRDSPNLRDLEHDGFVKTLII